jgi:hypothetical protein
MPLETFTVTPPSSGPAGGPLFSCPVARCSVSSSLQRIERATGLLECGRERGTAFLIKDDLIATCGHCILPHLEDRAEIRFFIGGRAIPAEMAEPDIPVEHDAVFLRLLEPLNERVAMPPLAASHVPRGLVWESFGYAAVRGRRGMVIRGTVDRSLDDETIPRDVELRYDSPDPPSSYKGFSGAPLIVDGAIRGIIQERLDGGIGAISLARLRSYLEAVSVEFRAIDDQPLSSAIGPGYADNRGTSEWASTVAARSRRL